MNMNVSILTQEAQRLLQLHEQDAVRLRAAELRPDWAQTVRLALAKLQDDPAAASEVLPLLHEFVTVANKAYRAPEARQKGVSLEPPQGSRQQDASPENQRVDQQPSEEIVQFSPEIDAALDQIASAIVNSIKGFASATQAYGRPPRETEVGDTSPPVAPLIFADTSEAPRVKVKMKDEGDKRAPCEIDGFDAFDLATYNHHTCTGASELECGDWQWATVTEVIEKDVIGIKYEPEKIVEGLNKVRLRLWKLITHSTVERYWTIQWQKCCCVWFWGVFRFPGDCKTYYRIGKQGVINVPQREERERPPVYDELITDWIAEMWDAIKKLADSAAQGAGSGLTSPIGPAAKDIVDPLVKKLVEKVKKAMGKEDSKTGGTPAGGSGGSVPPGHP